MPRTASADYGIDAPGVRRAMFAVGAVGAILAGPLLAFALHGFGAFSALAAAAAAVSGLAALYGIGMGAYMTHASRRGKRLTRERLLDLAESLAPWTGREAVLDVGCGRGLMLVGAALRLTAGRAVGIDLWRAEDQTGNRPEGALDNARREGIADRVSVRTGDACAIPYGAGAFDVVLSHWVVHNLPSAADRERAVREMIRVLRPGGTLVLADIAHHEAYGQILAASGWTGLRQDGGIGSRIIGALTGGSFRPRAWVGQKPA